MVAAVGGAAAALWLGVLTSISPCPLASNVAAVSYLVNNLTAGHKTLVSGLIYTAGRAVGYLGIGMIIVAGVLSIPSVAMFLQGSMNRILGPLLIAVGLVLLGVIRVRMPSVGGSERFQKIVDNHGIWGAALLGLVFSLSFCPISAALFFGSLIPLSIENQSYFLYPVLYGVGTGAPVVVFAVVISRSARAVGRAFKSMTRFEVWARRITGVVFLLAGGYYVLSYWLRVFVF